MLARRAPAMAGLLALAAVVLAVGAPAAGGQAAGTESVRGPVGWDVFRRLDLMQNLREGVRTLQSSSYDRAGGNQDGFRGTFSCPRRVPQGCVLAERDGPGEVDSIWLGGRRAEIAHIGRLRIELDGRVVVDAPLRTVLEGRLGAPFLFPLVATPRQSWGGAYVKVPMPFTSRMRVITSTNPGFFHVTYRAFDDASGVSTFDRDDPALDVVDTLRYAGLQDPKPVPSGTERERNREVVRIPPRGSAVVAELTGSGSIGELRIGPRILTRSPGAERAATRVLHRARLRISFDGMRTVDVPVGEFFGAGPEPARVRSLMFAAGLGSGGWYASWWPMPFRRSAVVELVNTSPSRSLGPVPVRVLWTRGADGEGGLTDAEEDGRTDGEAFPSGPERGVFHATSASALTREGRDWRYLEVDGAGVFYGVTHSMEGAAPPRHLEGDERVFVDGSNRPQIHGTGTEDFFEGGWYFLGRKFTLPLNGHPDRRHATSTCRRHCTSAYRLMIGDAVAFRSALRFGIEHGDRNRVRARYSSTAFWYGREVLLATRAGP